MNFTAITEEFFIFFFMKKKKFIEKSVLQKENFRATGKDKNSHSGFPSLVGRLLFSSWGCFSSFHPFGAL